MTSPQSDPHSGTDQEDRQLDYIPLKERLRAIPAAFSVILPLVLVLMGVLFVMLLLLKLFS